MKKLYRYSEKTDLMNIRIKIGTELFKFNLFEELKVNENHLNDEIAHQPPIQAFLGTLQTKLERIRADKEAELNKIYANLFDLIKSSIEESTHRPPSDDLAKQKVIKNKKYQEALKNYSEAKENYNIIRNCVESFSQRGFLIQTLSANIRKAN